MKINQNIQIGTFTINVIDGASIVQIGSSGMIQTHSESYQTTQMAPPSGREGAMPVGPPPPQNGVKVQVPGVTNNNNNSD